MIDPATEPPVPLSQVPRVTWLPRRPGGRKLHQSTIFRWAQRGLRGVPLEVIRCGGTLCTSEAALVRFFERLTTVDQSVAVTTTARSSREAARVDRALDQAGIR